MRLEKNSLVDMERFCLNPLSYNVINKYKIIYINFSFISLDYKFII